MVPNKNETFPIVIRFNFLMIVPHCVNSIPQEFGVEWDVDAPEGNCGKTALEFDWLRLGFCLFSTLLDNLDELLLDVLKGHLRHEGLNVNFLRVEEIEHVGEAVKGA